MAWGSGGGEPRICPVYRENAFDGQVSKNNSPRASSVLNLGECPSYPLCRVQSLSCNQSHSHVIHPVSRTHVRVSRSPTTFSPCPALSCFHTQTNSRSLSRGLPHAQYLAYTQPSSHIMIMIVTSHRTLTLHPATVPSHCLTFTWLALFRFRLPHSATLPFV